MKNKKEKLRAQVKSRFYYYFWGICTVAVVFGQLYVGTGYRIMADSFNRLIFTAIEEIQKPTEDNI
jgi:hypothetical protein|tara:strand:+ start:203 stop:400 length:198 start_codon:yes stop_codon:yes gene_type:complete